ncbi:MAG TPA: hypothetical protein VFT59_01840 [Candidatus Saccharimonadales bacterium]|nr:hypothetical protein [Candidatus Saccharimonadales bacterium]
METLLVVGGIFVGGIVIFVALRGSSGNEEAEADCICQKIRDLYGVDRERREYYRQLVEQVQQEDEKAMRQLFQLAGSIGNHRPCWVARGDYDLETAFCSVWPKVEARASEQGWR